MSTVKTRSIEYWQRITKERERKRKEKLATGELVIGLDKNGKPITLPARKETIIIELSKLLDRLCALCEEGEEELAIGKCIACGLPVCQYHSWGEGEGGILCDFCGPE